jgi:hypothetical protein
MHLPAVAVLRATLFTPRSPSCAPQKLLIEHGTKVVRGSIERFIAELKAK